jgi:signal peptidase I
MIVFALRVVVFQPYTIPSSSMEPGLQVGDYIIVTKYDYGWSRASIPFNPPLFEGRVLGRTPARGDVIVFRLPRDPKTTYIKRLIGLPGDRIQVSRGVVFVNGVPIPHMGAGPMQDHDEPWRRGVAVVETKPGGGSYMTFGGEAGHEGDDTAVYAVPAGSYFFMGDNRDNSLDSRWPADVGVGFVPAENLVGKAQFVLASWRRGASLFKPWTWITKLEPGRLIHRIQ